MMEKEHMEISDRILFLETAILNLNTRLAALKTTCEAFSEDQLPTIAPNLAEQLSSTAKKIEEHSQSLAELESQLGTAR